MTTADVSYFPTSTAPQSLTFADDIRLKSYSVAVSGTAFRVGQTQLYELAQGAPTNLNYIDGGLPGRRITLCANDDNTTLVPDWPNTGGYGVNRLVGNSNAPLKLNGGDSVTLHRRDPSLGGGWAIGAVTRIG